MSHPEDAVGYDVYSRHLMAIPVRPVVQSRAGGSCALPADGFIQLYGSDLKLYAISDNLPDRLLSVLLLEPMPPFPSA